MFWAVVAVVFAFWFGFGMAAFLNANHYHDDGEEA